jgi:hypothetical protein
VGEAEENKSRLNNKGQPLAATLNTNTQLIFYRMITSLIVGDFFSIEIIWAAGNTNTEINLMKHQVNELIMP